MFDNLTTTQKIEVFGGAGVVLFLLVVAFLHHSSGTTRATSSTSSSDVTQLANGIQQMQQAQSDAMNQMQQGQQTLAASLLASEQQSQQQIMQAFQDAQKQNQDVLTQLTGLLNQHPPVSQSPAPVYMTQPNPSGSTTPSQVHGTPYINDWWQKNVLDVGHTTREVMPGENVNQVLQSELNKYGASQGDAKIVTVGGKQYVELPASDALGVAIKSSNGG